MRHIDKKVYIAHPISGDVENNKKEVWSLIKNLHLENDFQWHHFIAPYLVTLECLDDKDYLQRQRGVANNKQYFDSNFIDELWLFGDKISTGMAQEIVWAVENNITVISHIRQESPFALYESIEEEEGKVCM